MRDSPASHVKMKRCIRPNMTSPCFLIFFLRAAKIGHVPKANIDYGCNVDMEQASVSDLSFRLKTAGLHGFSASWHLVYCRVARHHFFLLQTKGHKTSRTQRCSPRRGGSMKYTTHTVFTCVCYMYWPCGLHHERWAFINDKTGFFVGTGCIPSIFLVNQSTCVMEKPTNEVLLALGFDMV